MKNIFCAFLLIVSISACHTAGKSVNLTMQKQLHHKWMLKTIDSVDEALVLKAKAYINLTDTARASARAGCNGLGFAVKLFAANKISFTQGPSTMMYCAEFMSAEKGLISALTKVTNYSIEAQEISFKDKNGKVLITGVAEDRD